MRICVYCASSDAPDERYRADARSLGALLAGDGHELVYGGGGRGSMGALADAALAAGGRVVGVIPTFMIEREWAHRGLSQLEEVEDMRVRKHRMLAEADAVVALAGGCGTFEELFEAMTLKRLELFHGPIVVLNTLGYYDELLRFLEKSVAERFMEPAHLGLWQAVETPRAALEALRRDPAASPD
ncbi:MAG: TIGR00730 family Rossman fold protein [Planctomycetota bacterium]